MQYCLTRLTLLVAATAITSSAFTAFAGVADTRYDLQYYLDFSYNKGMFVAGASNVIVNYIDGTSVSDPVIPLTPNLDSYALKGQNTSFGFTPIGGAGLVAPQYVMSASHCGETDIFFLTENENYSTKYTSSGYHSSGGNWGTDWSIQRLNKIVTEVAYTPYASNDFMGSLRQGDWLYRLGHGAFLNTSGELIDTDFNALGGLVNISSIGKIDQNTWQIKTYIRENDTGNDVRPPLEIGVYSGDSGSPVYAWDEASKSFVQVAFASASTLSTGYGNDLWARYNATETENFIDSCTVVADSFRGSDKIIWGTQDTTTGAGTLTQGNVFVDYVGSGSGNTVSDHKGITFSTTDSENTQVLELQGSVNMGAGAMTFDSGDWKLTETNSGFTFNSAGFVVNEGASLTLELTGTGSEEWRKVGEGTLTIAGTGNNEVVLRVGGGTTVYNVTRDENGNITGCTLGNVGETRLARTDGYAASSVRLEAGVAILVLMQDNQFKTNSVAGDTFTFGNAGGLLNLNGHDLTWAVVNQDGSGTGARIGNFTPLGEVAPGKATFTYTGTGTFEGCFMDEGESGAQLAVVYNNADSGTWTLTGNHSNVGGFTVNAGTMILQGANTPHVNITDVNDWTYASLEGSDVSVKSGATFRLSHHALMSGNVDVEDSGTFELTQTVNAASESVVGSLRQDMASLNITSLKGNVTLNGSATMSVNTDSPVATTMQGNISGSSASFNKTGSGLFVVNGQVSVGTGSITAGGVVATDKTDFTGMWTIGEQGFLGVEGMTGDALLAKVSTASSGVLALTTDQTTALDLTNYQNLIIGAWGDVAYGASDKTLATVSDGIYGDVWRLGGGTGTLTVNFKLTGNADLLIGNEWSSGTVHLANTNNDFTGDIYLLGLGNKLSYAEGALGNSRVNLSYGNAVSLTDASQISAIKGGSVGVLALASSGDLDVSSTQLTIGAYGDLTYRGTLTVGDTYRFGGSGNLTLDTTLDGASKMELDGQGSTGSSVIFARENAFSGDIVAGGGRYLETANSFGDIAIRVSNDRALANAASITLENGAMLCSGGRDIEVRNLTLQSGSSLRNECETVSRVNLNVSEGFTAEFADGVLNNNYNTGQINLVKTGAGTLTMAHNASWTGTLVVNEGTVVVTTTGDSYATHGGGIGSNDSTIWINESGRLKVNMKFAQGSYLGGTAIQQTLRGSGTVAVASGGAVLFSTQGRGLFTGTVSVEENTRLYLGVLNYNGNNKFNTLNAVADATVNVTSGSQARVTNALTVAETGAISTTADFVISGTGFAGTDNGLCRWAGSPYYARMASLNTGALAIDNMSTVYGTITLAGDATISSTSSNPFAAGSSGTLRAENGYGIKEKLGGIIRGRILGATGLETLTFGGNEGMTITADFANTYGDLVIANGNGNNTDKFALRLNGGKAVSQTSTALGCGSVTLKDNLILRLAGTGTANQPHIEYTYANDIAAGNNATLQSYNITNKLAGTVTMSGTTLNLATANGGVLELSGGISGTGTLNVAANSKIIWGSASSAMALDRTGMAQFSGEVVTGAEADITLASSVVVATTTTFSGTDSLALRLLGTEDYTLGGIVLTDSETTDAVGSVLTLGFDFTNASAEDYTTLTVTNGITANATTITLTLNMFNDIESGTYELISSVQDGATYSLADTLNGLLSLSAESGKVIMIVGKDNKLYWRGESGDSWSAANWYQESSGETLIAFTSDANVALDSSGVDSETNSASVRETISVTGTQTVGLLAAKESYYEISGDGSISGNTLAIGLGGDLKLSNTGGNTFSGGVTLNDGALTASGNTLTADVVAENDSAFKLADGASLSGNLTLTDSSATISDSTLNGNVSLYGNAFADMTDATITGSVASKGGSLTLTSAKLRGNLSVTADRDTLHSTGLTILGGTFTSNAVLDFDRLMLQDGTLQINSAATIDNLGVAAAKTVTLWNATASAGADKVLGIVELGKDAILQTNDREAVTAATHIGTLQLNGDSATLRDQNHSGSFTVDTLALGDGVTSATLNLTKQASSANMTTFVLGASGKDAGDFSGTIVLRGSASVNANSGDRSAGIVLAHDDVAKDAVISLLSNTSGNTNSVLALGVNTANATIAGLSSGSSLGSRAIVYSGSLSANEAWGTANIDGTQTNSLTINTAANTTHEFYGQVYGSLNLVIDGEGTQRFLGMSSSFDGTIDLQGGTLAVNAAGRSLLSGASSVSIGAGTLDLSAIDFSDSANSITLAGTLLSVADTATIAFGAMSVDTEYSVFSIVGGEINGWTNLKDTNFLVDGVRLSDLGRVNVSLSLGGSFSYTLGDGWDLVWDGGNETTVWNQNEENTIWETTQEDVASGEPVAVRIGFRNNDNVTFKSDADLTLEGAIHVNDLTVTDNVSLVTRGDLTVTGDLTIGNGISWDFSGGTSLSFAEAELKTAKKIVVGEGATLTMTDKVTGQNNRSTAFDNVSGFGNVVLNLAEDNGIGFNLSGISGDITVATGRLQLNTSTFNEASTIRLASSAAQLVFNGNGVDLKNAVSLETSTTIHVNSTSSGGYVGTISGVINGSGKTLTKAGGGTLILSGETNLGGLIIDSGSVNLSGAMTLDGLSRLQTNAGTSIRLLDGASIKRTNNVACWVRGDFEVLADAKAEFVSVDDVHLNYENANGHGNIVLKENSELTMTINKFNFYTGGCVTINRNAALKLTNSNVHVFNKGTGVATIVALSSGQLYSMNNANFELTNAHVKNVANNDSTLNNKLTNSSVENAGGGLLMVSNAGNTISGLSASGGDIKLANQANELVLGELIVGAGKTLSAYKGTEETEVNEATIRVTGTAEFGAGARLNADLVLANGATLEVSAGGVIMGSTVTLEQSVSLGASALEQANDLVDGGKMVLFTGVDELILGSGDHAKIFNVANDASEENYLSASDYFSNLGNNSLLLYFSGEAGGTFGLLAFSSPIPEPSAFGLLAGLSALALAGSRRRRGKRA